MRLAALTIGDLCKRNFEKVAAYAPLLHAKEVLSLKAVRYLPVIAVSVRSPCWAWSQVFSPSNHHTFDVAIDFALTTTQLVLFTTTLFCLLHCSFVLQSNGMCVGIVNMDSIHVAQLLAETGQTHLGEELNCSSVIHEGDNSLLNPSESS